MAEATLFKDLMAKMDTILAVLDQQGERIKMIEKSLATVTQYIKNQQIPDSVTALHAALQNFSESSSQMDFKHLPPVQMPPIELDFPHFDGSDVLQWIFRAELFFDFYKISDPYRLNIAAFHMEGPVIPWFQMLQKCGELTSWCSLVKAVEATYGPSDFDHPRYAIYKLQQQNTVSDYYSSFNALACRVEGLSSAALLDCFISGLKRDIQLDVILWQPDSLTKAVTLAKLFEEKYYPHGEHLVKNPVSPDISSSTKLAAPPMLTAKLARPKNTSPLPAAAVSSPVNSSTAAHPVKHISFNELQLRKAKGLCFYCDKTYSPLHKCPNKCVLVHRWDEEPSQSPAVEFLIAPDQVHKVEEQFHSFSLNDMNSHSTPSEILAFGHDTGSILSDPHAE